MNVTKGKIKAPVRAVIYGPEGIGKTTFASQWPAPLFVDLEAGTLRLAVDRVQPSSFAAVEQIVADLTKDAGGYKTLVFDTADWLEKRLVDHVCAAANQPSIEAFGYGKGYMHLAEAWKRFLDAVSRMQEATGMHVVFLAHAAMRKFEQPDEAGAYDRWELKLLKQSPAVLKEWADMVLFLNYRTLVIDVDGKKKAQGGQRVMYANHHSCWDAKNRFGLADEMPMEFAKLAPVFAEVPATVTAPTTTIAKPPEKTEAEKDLAPTTKPATVEDPEKAGLLRQLSDLMTASKVSKEELCGEMARKGVCPVDMSPREYNVATLRRITGNWAAVCHNINLHKEQKAA
jgi:GTPase SAR1 family protein